MSIGSMKRGLYPMMSGGSRSSSGTYVVNEAAANITGFGAGAMPDFTLHWEKQGRVVMLWLATGGTYTATSTSTAFTITGIPTDIRPTTTTVITAPTGVIDGGVGMIGRCQITSAGTIAFQRGSVAGTDLTFSSTGFAAAGSKGLSSSFQLMYVCTP